MTHTNILCDGNVPPTQRFINTALERLAVNSPRPETGRSWWTGASSGSRSCGGAPRFVPPRSRSCLRRRGDTTRLAFLLHSLSPVVHILTPTVLWECVTYSMMSSMVRLMICFTLSVSSSAIPCSPMLKDASLVLPSYLSNRTFQHVSTRQTVGVFGRFSFLPQQNCQHGWNHVTYGNIDWPHINRVNKLSSSGASL